MYKLNLKHVLSQTGLICHRNADMIYDMFVTMQLSCHLVAALQYTFTHKQYIEQHKTNNT